MRAGGGTPRRGLWLTFLSPFGLDAAVDLLGVDTDATALRAGLKGLFG